MLDDINIVKAGFMTLNNPANAICLSGTRFSTPVLVITSTEDDKLYFNLYRKILADWPADIKGSISEGNDQGELIQDIPVAEL